MTYKEFVETIERAKADRLVSLNEKRTYDDHQNRGREFRKIVWDLMDSHPEHMKVWRRVESDSWRGE